MVLLAAVAGLLVPATARADTGGESGRAITVCTQPLGPYDRGLLAVAERGIRYLYGLEVVRLPAKKLPKASYYAKRKRYRADRLLDHIAADIVPGSGCNVVVGFTKRDISATKGDRYDWGILGYGQIGGTAAMVSSYRMRGTSRRNQMKRAVKVVNHELGHVLGVDHYDGDRKGCLMNDGRGTVKTVDREHGLLCPESIATIERARRVTLPRHRRFDWRRVLPR